MRAQAIVAFVIPPCTRPSAGLIDRKLLLSAGVGEAVAGERSWIQREHPPFRPARRSCRSDRPRQSALAVEPDDGPRREGAFGGVPRYRTGPAGGRARDHRLLVFTLGFTRAVDWRLR
jgi:hypothetical protein